MPKSSLSTEKLAALFLLGVLMLGLLGLRTLGVLTLRELLEDLAGAR